MKYLVRLVKRLTNGLPVEVHTHNDFGMALATELAGVEAGAEVVHSCANGLGERTGNAALEELIVALHVLYGFETPYRLDRLPEPSGTKRWATRCAPPRSGVSRHGRSSPWTKSARLRSVCPRERHTGREHRGPPDQRCRESCCRQRSSARIRSRSG